MMIRYCTNDSKYQWPAVKQCFTSTMQNLQNAFQLSLSDIGMSHRR